ncbi:MAG: ADP-ribosylglycohydrolase family protein [Acidobacteria bacterium]|nr:ADP-ribosylglycohydrolase family protein [Acidobacteriota bacterium]
MVKTSESDPIRVAAVTPADGHGRIGITLCPGKTDPAGISGAWARDLGADLDAIEGWGATAVVSLITDAEMDYLGVRGLAAAVRARHMEWWHAPIPDGRPPGPDFEDRWAVAGPALRDRLRAGFDILVHCRGGLGRAGTVAARLLVELGAGAEDAVRRVREARSPHAVETRSQEAHVAACAARAPSAAPAARSRSAESIRDRARGALLGLAVGDAVGTTLEFSIRDTRPRLEDMVGGGPFDLPAGAWTDDTTLALALAESLAEAGDFDGRDLLDRFVDWWRNGSYSCNGHCFDIGITTRTALERYVRTGDPRAGSTEPNSAGNGSLMRLAPVALRYWHDREQLSAVAAAQSRTTHGATEAVDACRAFAGLLADAIAGAARPDVLGTRRFDGAPAIARILAGSWRGRARDTIDSSGYVAHTLEAALWSVARTGDFRGAVLLAANLAHDADTVAAVTGQLAGALYGLSGIPEGWLDRVAWRGRLLAVADRLVAPSLGSPPPPL